jgi:hypothetical protein
MQKVFVTGDNQATFACPACKKMRTVDVTRQQGLDQAVRIKVKCPCGCQYPVMLERRQQHRKKVNFPGAYVHLKNMRPVGKGIMLVTDLSRAGIKVTVNDERHFAVGDRLEVEFRLDDLKRSLIRKEVIIRKVDGGDLGTQFAYVDAGDPCDKAIGFYLFG